MAIRRDVALLDTDVWSHLYGLGSRPHPRAAHWRTLLVGRTAIIATQTRAEVLVGLRKLGGVRRGQILFELDKTITVPVDEDVVQRYARLTADAQARGDALWDKIHTGDRWVAATALAINAPLLAVDQVYNSHPDLQLLDQPEGHA